MSTPYSGGQDPQGGAEGYQPHEPGGYGTPAAGSASYTGYNGYGGDGGYGDYNAYDVNYAAAGHGATQYHGTSLVDGTYGDGYEPHRVNDPQANGWYHAKGTGKIDVMQAWAFGFKQTFANWKVWVPVGLIFALLPAALGLFVTPLAGFVQFAFLFAYPVVYSLALLQTLNRNWKFDGVNSPTYGTTLGMIILVGLIYGFAILIPIFGSLPFFAVNLADTLQGLDPAQIESDPTVLMPLAGAILGILGIALVVSFLLAPLFVFQVWYAADNADTFGGSFSQGFRAGARNYGQLLLFYLLYGVMMFVSLFTLGIATVILMPAYTLALAFAYRQASGGPVPVEPQAVGA
ncbi:hypothetical protein [Corynebacterium liangguodongii]|uniref:Uncharacterized protein n=1 Tax=Corynebacterium liangguodongii TaxID=2079535 RepID=A0A2S0WGN1_9CORY|nr:hypothetical protein [Corynebacterium liangguodongii]AWB84929.1 hypothetical protein C3E79_10980 [Corynebacterium liangguodongii]PWB99363.1 hypothetical protein DF219_07295 [Corynebacterium liangguodongii]